MIIILFLLRLEIRINIRLLIYFPSIKLTVVLTLFKLQLFFLLSVFILKYNESLWRYNKRIVIGFMLKDKSLSFF